MKKTTLICVLLAGCYQPAWKDPAKLSFDGESDLYTCMRIGQMAQMNKSQEMYDRLKVEREKRGLLLADQEYQSAKDKKVYVGGSECLLYAA